MSVKRSWNKDKKMSDKRSWNKDNKMSDKRSWNKDKKLSDKRSWNEDTTYVGCSKKIVAWSKNVCFSKIIIIFIPVISSLNKKVYTYWIGQHLHSKCYDVYCKQQNQY